VVSARDSEILGPRVDRHFGDRLPRNAADDRHERT
jgi:hypothetical protein